MNECRIVEDLIPLYAEDLTNEEAAEFVKNHVEGCDHCRKLLERCAVSVPSPEEDAKAYKRAMHKNVMNMTCRIIAIAVIVAMVMFVGCTKLEEYMNWKEGRTPVEQIVKAPTGNGEVTLVDWEASGQKFGVADNVGTIIWIKMMDVRQDEHGTGYNISDGAYSEPWENVQVYWAPNGKNILMTADLIQGGKGIFIHTERSWYDEEGRHFGESELLPRGVENGFVDVLTALCKENVDFPTGWETVEFSFHQWGDDSETITFVYETDNGHRGVLDYHYPTEAIIKVN